MAIRIVAPNDNFRGMSYGDWIEIWSNWLFSGYPNYVADEDIIFCRGFLEFAGSSYDITQQSYIVETPRLGDQKPTKDIIRTTERRLFLNKDRDCEVDLSDRVPKGTAVFIPLLTAMYSIGNRYEGRTLDNEFDLRRAVLKDTYESREVFFKLRRPEGSRPRINLVPDYRFETRLFTIRISESSPFIGYQRDEIQAGEYESVAGGYFLIISDLPEAEYTLEFGGKGRDGYRTRTVHRIEVVGDRRDLTKDTSSQKITTGNLPTF
jgi:hypothetical protein